MATILHPKVIAAILQNKLEVEELPCDPDYADTAAFNEKYGFSADEGANTIIVTSKKIDPPVYAVCVVLASTRLDVNKAVTRAMCIKKASFADSSMTKQLSEMEIGGVTAVGVGDLPIYIDSAVLQVERIVMGGGNRTSKIVLAPSELLKLPNVTIIEGLAKLS